MKAGTALAAVVALAAIAPATAAADQRYASPGGTPADACTQPDPCDLETAVEGAVDGDEVIVEPGLHTPPGQVSLTTATVVHGAEGQPAPQVVSAAVTAISVTDPEAVLRWLDVRHVGLGDALLLDDGLGERLTVRSASAGLACHVRGATLRDSACWATSGGVATGMTTAGSLEETLLVNVTAFGSGPGSRGLRVWALPSSFADLAAVNLIAKGAIDTELLSTSTSVAKASINFSNFATQRLEGPESHATPPGLARNQTVPPILVNPDAGDFRQDPDSPTVDRGTLELGAEASDVEGDPRVQGFGIDIGADELVVGPLPPDTNPPETKILKMPDARSKRRVSKFKFGTTEPVGAVFMCSIDARAFSRCNSPKKYRAKRGKRHNFAVYSIDAAGNVDPSPDTYSWKVKAKGG